MTFSATQIARPDTKPAWTSFTTVEVDDALFQEVKDKVAIPLNILANLVKTPSDVYLAKINKETHSIEFIKILRGGSLVSAKLISTIQKLGLEEVYVPSPRLGNLVQVTQEATQAVIQNQAVPTVTKAKLLHDSAKLLATVAIKEKKIGESVQGASAYVDTVADFVHKVPEAMGDLAQMLTLDYSLYTHSVNVCLFALCFAEFIRLPPKEAKALGMGALFHDVGKTRITPDILKKPGPLNADEWQVMRQHCSIGFDILEKHPGFGQQSLLTVLHHHENMDGSGYPAGLKENELPITSRISKILDCYDAITSTRCYKAGLTGYEAIQQMHETMLPQLSQDLLTQFVHFLGFLGRKAGRKGSPRTVNLVLGPQEE